MAERRTKPGHVLCAECDDFVSKETKVRFNNKNYHPECAQKAQEKKELNDYICRKFAFKKPGPRVNSQITKYLEMYPYYTYKGILEALQYFYDVLNRPVPEKIDAMGIGIVPSVYDDAQKYYYSVAAKQERVAEEISEALSAEPQETVIIIKKKKKEKKFYNLDEL
jgi:hypothetical protein